MKTRRRIGAAAVLLALCCLFPLPVQAAERTIQKEYTFLSESPEFAYEPEKEIREHGKTYSLKGITYQQVKVTSPYLCREKTYKGLSEKKVPQKHTFSINGETKRLTARKENIRYSQRVETVTETLTGVTGNPTFSGKKEVHKNGKTYTASLLGVKEKKGRKPFTATVTFTGAPQADFYFQGKKVRLKEGQPVWDGYKTAILRYLKLEAGSTITGIAWSGAARKEGGRTVRYAQVRGTRPVADYVATYQYPIYDAEVLYDNGEDPNAKEYTVRAVCTYEKAGWSMAQKAFVAGAGLCVLALLVNGILFLLRRRKKQEDR